MMRTSHCLLVLVLMASACSKSKKPEPQKEDVTADAPKKAEGKPKVKKQELDPIEALARTTKTAEDFEEEAERRITDENLEEELEKLEKQLAAADDSTATSGAGTVIKQ